MCVCVFIKLHITAQSGPVILVILCHSHLPSVWVCVFVCIVIPFILDVRLVDAPAGATQEKGRTGFFHLPFAAAVPALIFIARRIQPSLSLVDEKSCVTPAGTSNELDVQNKWEENTCVPTATRNNCYLTTVCVLFLVSASFFFCFFGDIAFFSE